MNATWTLIIRGVISGLLQIGLFAATLLIPAGTWHWSRALQFLFVYGIMLLGFIVALALLAPHSLEARLQNPTANSQPHQDRVITWLLSIFLIVWLILIPIDVFYWQLMPTPPFWVSSILGIILLLAGFGILMTAIFQNAFATPTVSYQSERGQVLVDTGLYSCIRHPLYLGLLLFLIGLGLWLESFSSLLFLSVISIIIVARISIEEKTLAEKLTGYSRYMAMVRYRLIPFIW